MIDDMNDDMNDDMIDAMNDGMIAGRGCTAYMFCMKWIVNTSNDLEHNINHMFGTIIMT